MINQEWKDLLKHEVEKEYFKNMIKHINNQIKDGKTIYPPTNLTYNALYLAPKDIKIIIVGQDPYHNPNQANGLAFSVEKGVTIPPSLKNIYKELELEYQKKMPAHGDLTGWRNQGVMLLNTSLSVEKNSPASHSKIGWQTFTDKIISIMSEKYDNNVYILWGAHAKEKIKLIDNTKNLVLTSAHPSPFSATKFFNNNHFKLANEYLNKCNKKEIDWFAI